ncbi:ribonuclease H-like domain-containing protein [Tanacetum coccineum]
MPSKPDFSFSSLEEFVNEPIVSEPTVKKPVVETSEAKASTDKPKAVKKNNGALIIEDWVSDSEEEDMPQAKIQKKTIKPSFDKIVFVKSKEQVKTPRKTTVKQVNQNRQNTHSPIGNQRNWMYMMSQILGSNFEMINKACYVYGSFDHLQAIHNTIWMRKGWIEQWMLRHNDRNIPNLSDLEIDGGICLPLRKPALGFMKQFGCRVIILNTIDHLGKFDGKADEGFFVGYSINSKAFRVFNNRTRIVEENLHVQFSENTPNIAGSGPNWLFDIDAPTKSMNYKPVIAGKHLWPGYHYSLKVQRSTPEEEFKPVVDDE